MNLPVRDISKYKSLFNTEAHPDVTNTYQVYPTIEVITEFGKAGWEVTKVMEQNVRIAANSGFQKHMIRFRKTNAELLPGGIIPEIVLINSHNGKSAYRIMAGVFRCVCSNGLVVPESTVAHLSVQHKGHNPGDVVTASMAVIADLPKAVEELNRMRRIMLSGEEQLVLAKAAHILRYPEPEEAEEVKPQFSPHNLLTIRRSEDQPPTLYNVFNRIQENIINGGRTRTATGRPVTMRKIKGIDKNTALNTALWLLATEMANLKEGTV